MAVATVVTALLVLLIENHTPGMNGPHYWQWAWRRIDPIRVLLWLGLAALPALLAVPLYWKTRRVIAPLALITISTFALQYAAVGVSHFPFRARQRVIDIVNSPSLTGYHTDAQKWMLDSHGPSVSTLLAEYPQRMSQMDMHTRIRPPGPLLLHAATVYCFGAQRAPLAAGLGIMALTAFSPIATFLFLKYFTQDATAALHGACLIAFSTSLVWFTPMLDGVWPILTCLSLTLWGLALEETTPTRRAWYGLAFGVFFAAATFMTYNVLVLGVFMLGFAILTQRRRLFAAALWSVIGFAAINVLLWIWFRYSAVSVFATALRNQSQMAQNAERPYPGTIPYDLYDFFLGAGFTLAVLTLFYLAGKYAAAPPRQRAVVLVCLLQIGATAATGLLRVETLRVWAFMIPLLVLPAVMEMSDWTPTQRFAVLLAHLALTMSVGGNMLFTWIPLGW